MREFLDRHSLDFLYDPSNILNDGYAYGLQLKSHTLPTMKEIEQNFDLRQTPKSNYSNFGDIYKGFEEADINNEEFKQKLLW